MVSAASDRVNGLLQGSCQHIGVGVQPKIQDLVLPIGGEVRHHFLDRRRTGDDYCSFARLHVAVPSRMHDHHMPRLYTSIGKLSIGRIDVIVRSLVEIGARLW